MFRARRFVVVFVTLLLAGGGLAVAAEQAGQKPVIAIGGKVKQPRQFDLEALRRLPVEHAQATFEGERGTQKGSFAGVLLWTLLTEAGGLQDTGKGGELRHVIKVAGRDGYVVVISTGEIAPEFGGKPAILAYERDGAPLGNSGFRLVMPGDKRGGRNVRDVVIVMVQ